MVPARVLPYEGIPYQSAPGCPGARAGCPGARFRPGSTIQVDWSTIQVAREHNLALPWIGCPGARSWLPGSTFREHNLALPQSNLRARSAVAREHAISS